MIQYNCVLFLVSAEAKPGHRHKGQGVQAPRHSPEAVCAALRDVPPGPPSEAHEGGGERPALPDAGFLGVPQLVTRTRGAVLSGVRERAAAAGPVAAWLGSPVALAKSASVRGSGSLGDAKLGLLRERTVSCKTEVRR